MSAVKRAVKGVGRFVKKHWKKIVVAALVVFTAGAALGGLAATKGAFAAKGVLGGIGATLKAGAAGIGSVLTGGGIAGAKTAAAGSFGAGAAKAAATAATTAGKIATTAKTTAGAGKAAASTAKIAATTGKTAATAGKAATTAGTVGKASSLAAPVATTAGAAGAGATTALTQAAGAAAPAAKVGFMNTLGGAALIQGGIGALSGALQGAAEEENEPQGFFGVGLNGNASINPGSMAFRDPNITGGASSFRRPLIYDTAPAGG